MSIALIPKELILHIGNILKIEQKEKIAIISYPIWNLYATCKLFSWLSELEYLCVEYANYHYKIITRNINGKFCGMAYDGFFSLRGYYQSGKRLEGYNYSKMSDDCPDWRLDVNIVYYGRDRDLIDPNTYEITMYHEHQCNRETTASCENSDCIVCSQLNIIQKEIFDKDQDVADIFKNRNKYSIGTVIIRPRTQLLHFKFNYQGFSPLYIRVDRVSHVNI